MVRQPLSTGSGRAVSWAVIGFAIDGSRFDILSEYDCATGAVASSLLLELGRGRFRTRRCRGAASRCRRRWSWCRRRWRQRGCARGGVRPCAGRRVCACTRLGRHRCNGWCCGRRDARRFGRRRFAASARLASIFCESLECKAAPEGYGNECPEACKEDHPPLLPLPAHARPRDSIAVPHVALRDLPQGGSARRTDGLGRIGRGRVLLPLARHALAYNLAGHSFARRRRFTRAGFRMTNDIDDDIQCAAMSRFPELHLGSVGAARSVTLIHIDPRIRFGVGRIGLGEARPRRFLRLFHDRYEARIVAQVGTKRYRFARYSHTRPCD